MARRSPPSARFRTRILLTVVIAVSEEEKNAEQAMRKIKISTVSKIRVRNLAEGGDRRAILLSRLIEDVYKRQE